MVLLPQAAQLLVQNIGAHGKRADHRVHVDIPNFGSFVSGSRKQVGAIRTPTDGVNSSVMGLAFSQSTHFLSRLPVIDVDLAISAGRGKSVPSGEKRTQLTKRLWSPIVNLNLNGGPSKKAAQLSSLLLPAGTACSV